KGPEGKGMPYDEISGTFDIKDGIATTEDLRLRSPAVRASAVGQIDLPNGTVDEHLAVQPLQITDSLLKTIGNAPIIKQVGIGTLLFGRKRSIVVVAYRVHGPITDPEVTRVENKVIDQGVLGIFQRTLELPAGALSGGDSGGDKEASEEKPSSGPESSN
ncbi:MAG: AsmA-like C-terminal region-containing protein, partial [Candidatus Methylomirabilales bacterium]